jgi:hypothetical protein
MNKILLTSIAALFLATGAAHAADARPRVMICEGQWSDMRTIGLMIGGCDVNFIPAKKLKQIKDVCGEPWNPTGSEENVDVQCRIKAVVVPFTNQRGAKVHKVTKVLRVLDNADDQ